MFKITMVKDFILLQFPVAKIILPQNRKMVGTAELVVTQIGPGCKEVKLGDRLLVAPEAVVPFGLDGKDYFLTREENIGGVIRDENNKN